MNIQRRHVDCRWGYKSVDELGEVVAKYRAADIPLEAMWTDIDYMDGYLDFSLDPNRFSKDKMQALAPGLERLCADEHFLFLPWMRMHILGHKTIVSCSCHESGQATFA